MDSTAVLSSLTPNPPITPTSPPTAPNVSTTDVSTTDVSTTDVSPPDYTIPISILGVSVIALGIIGYFLYSEMIKKK